MSADEGADKLAGWQRLAELMMVYTRAAELTLDFAGEFAEDEVAYEARRLRRRALLLDGWADRIMRTFDLAVKLGEAGDAATLRRHFPQLFKDGK